MDIADRAKSIEVTRGELPPAVPPAVRPPKPNGTFFRALDVTTERTFSLRALSVETDLELFHCWQNKPRVAETWNEQGSLEYHKSYLENIERDPHIFSAIGSIDGAPSAYFEIYWAQEDRLGQHYAAHSHDRGFHMLVGEYRHIGKGFGAAWIRIVSCSIFSSEPATMKICTEPNVRNNSMRRILVEGGYVLAKEFDFPHKRAALLECTRDRFFGETVRAHEIRTLPIHLG